MDKLHHSHVTYAQLVAGGLSQADIEARVRGGGLVKLRRGVFAPSEDLDLEAAHLRLIHATLPDVHPSNVVSHESAAVLHGLAVPAVSLQRVNMTRRATEGGGPRSHGYASSMLRIRNTKLLDDEITVLHGITVTTLTRTAFDLARSMPYPWAVAACDGALRLGVERESLLAMGRQHRRMRGLPRLRQAVEFADPRSESPFESVSRVQFARYGVPKPELQFVVRDQDGNWVARSDFCWQDHGVVGECDGHGKYGRLLKPGQTPQGAILNEKRRDDSIRDAGYWPIHWDTDLIWDGRQLADRVLRALRGAR